MPGRAFHFGHCARPEKADLPSPAEAGFAKAGSANPSTCGVYAMPGRAFHFGHRAQVGLKADSARPNVSQLLAGTLIGPGRSPGIARVPNLHVRPAGAATSSSLDVCLAKRPLADEVGHKIREVWEAGDKAGIDFIGRLPLGSSLRAGSAP